MTGVQTCALPICLSGAGEIQATVGYDTPPNNNNPYAPTLNAYVSSDTPDPDLTNNAIGFTLYYPHRFVIPPVPPSYDPEI